MTELSHINPYKVKRNSENFN